jgi:Zn-dependent protease
VPVGVNAGILVIIVLVGLGLGLGRFPQLHPDRPAVAYLVAGAVAAVLLVASILIHELAHAVVARANGVEVDRIVLWLLGGTAQLRSEPRTPGADLAVAVAGPATSVALGGVFWLANIAWLAIAGDGLVAATLGYLAFINVLLAVFNLMPAAPLDGGRVLRAAVWAGTGDRTRAAVLAARAGRFLGLALIVFGFAQVLLFGAIGGLWLALIGWFLVTAAQAEENHTVLNQRLRGVRVRDAMGPPPVTATPDATVAQFIDDVVLRQQFSTYPLVDDGGGLAGLVTLNRIRRVPVEERAQTRLHDIATPPAEVPTGRPDEPLVDVLPRLAAAGDGRAVVVDDAGRVVGLISPRDITAATIRAELREGEPAQPTSNWWVANSR